MKSYSDRLHHPSPTHPLAEGKYVYQFSPSKLFEQRLKGFIKPEHYLAERALYLYSSQFALNDPAANPVGRAAPKRVSAAQETVINHITDKISLAGRAALLDFTKDGLRFGFQLAPDASVRDKLERPHNLDTVDSISGGLYPMDLYFSLPSVALDKDRANHARDELTHFLQRGSNGGSAYRTASAREPSVSAPVLIKYSNKVV